MIRKMRWRLIGAAMLAFTAVIAMIAILVNIVNYVEVTHKADQAIERILRYEEREPERFWPEGIKEPKGPEIPEGFEGTENPMGMEGLKGPEAPEGFGGAENPGAMEAPKGPFQAFQDVETNYMTRFFVVRMTSDNESSAYTEYIAAIDKEEAVRLADEVAQKSKDKGYIGDYRYVKEEIGDSTVIVFLNVSKDLQAIKSLRNLTLAVVAVSLILVFILVYIFSKRAIKPIVQNIEQQKQFITDASHELKTPLTSISTSMDVITMEHGEDEWTENIRNQTTRMTKLVGELVALSRLDEIKPLPAKENFSVSNAAWEIVEVYQPQAKAREKKFHVEIQDDVFMIGEKDAIQQMLSVLLDNAIRYSNEKGEIRFSLKKSKNKVRIEVFNTCHFDTPPDVNRLFDRFYRPDSSRNSDTGGNGVGLAIAKAVAETHNGKTSGREDVNSFHVRVIA